MALENSGDGCKGCGGLQHGNWVFFVTMGDGAAKGFALTLRFNIGAFRTFLPDNHLFRHDVAGAFGDLRFATSLHCTEQLLQHEI